MRVRGLSIYGGLTDVSRMGRVSYEDAETCLRELNGNTALTVNTGGNVNNNNKNNQNSCRPVAAYLGNGGFPSFLESAWEAYDDCLKGKRTSPQAVEYMPTAHDDIPLLAAGLWNGTYRPSVSDCFMVTFPKLREVFAASFRDRIVHHWICLRLVPLFEERDRMLGDVSHACRKGFGTRTAIAQVEDAMERVSHGYTRPAWIYRGDIVGFFMNIRKSLMLRMLERLIEERYDGSFKDILMHAVGATVLHCPEKECRIKSGLWQWDAMPRDKSMFYIDNDRGMPIGNLTTQRFADYYMSHLDGFVVDRLRVRFGDGWHEHAGYTRSVDDFCVTCDDRAFLLSLVRDIASFVRERLFLECHGEKVYFQPVSHGVKFLGKWLKPKRRYTIGRTTGRLGAAMRRCLAECGRGMNLADAQRHMQSINSYLGLLRDTRSYNIRRRVLLEGATPAFFGYFNIVNLEKITIKKNPKSWKMCV